MVQKAYLVTATLSNRIRKVNLPGFLVPLVKLLISSYTNLDPLGFHRPPIYQCNWLIIVNAGYEAMGKRPKILFLAS